MQTKVVKDPALMNHKKENLEKDVKWVRQIVSHEQAKPLEVSKHYMLEYEKDALLKSERLANQVQRHLQTLQKIRGSLEDRAETTERAAEYRSWKQSFATKKSDVLW